MERVVCLNCIDGRTQLPVIHWIKENYGAENVDMITEPGMDGLWADPKRPVTELVQKLNISLNTNQAAMIFIAAHHDCRGNPVSEAEHKEHIYAGVKRLKQEFPDMPVIGLWVNDQWETVKQAG